MWLSKHTEIFDIRRCCKDRNNEDTVVNTAARSTINQELEALEIVAMNQPSAAVHHASSDNKGGRNEPPCRLQKCT